jgi:hypothetical protein
VRARRRPSDSSAPALAPRGCGAWRERRPRRSGRGHCPLPFKGSDRSVPVLRGCRTGSRTMLVRTRLVAGEGDSVTVHGTYYALDVADPGSCVSRPALSCAFLTCFRGVFCVPCQRLTPQPPISQRICSTGWSPTPRTRVCRLFCRCLAGRVSTVDTRRPVLPAAGRARETGLAEV